MRFLNELKALIWGTGLILLLLAAGAYCLCRNGREMCRVVRVLYDFLDVEQFEVMLERMGR